jgi:hypothetical protein
MGCAHAFRTVIGGVLPVRCALGGAAKSTTGRCGFVWVTGTIIDRLVDDRAPAGLLYPLPETPCCCRWPPP